MGTERRRADDTERRRADDSAPRRLLTGSVHVGDLARVTAPSAAGVPSTEPRAGGRGPGQCRGFLHLLCGCVRRGALAYGALTLIVGVLAERAIGSILAKVGHAGAALDDAYIHFQYARALAEGHPLRFYAGAPRTSGATSVLWPLVLAPFWALGARDDAILWPAWALSFLALGGLAWEAARITERLAGRTAAAGAGAMTVAFAAFAWCAASGMETVPFAWAVARASRRASEWAEAPAAERTRGRELELLALAWVAALFRPEGALAALFVAATFGVFPVSTDGRPQRRRAVVDTIAACAAVTAVPLMFWAATGSPKSNTAAAKLLPGNPYYSGAALATAVGKQAELLVGTLLNGEVWSAEFVPHHGAVIAMAGLGAVAALGVRTGRRWRAAATLLIALTMFAPCFYLTFLWNRLRYLWPFATGWIVGLACLARLVGDLAAMLHARRRAVTAMACGFVVGSFASKLEWALDDVAQSASGIDRQQVALGRWAKANLAPEALVGLNDTGAIAYFGDRRTFDIVGLTTRGEARYWVAGAGSRLEHYERLHATEASSLPTHFIVYPEWMAMDSVLGAPLQEATVTDATILGGRTMRAYVADWSKLGTGEKPWTPSGATIDTLDVADLESEADHAYELFEARDGEQVAREGVSPDGEPVIDGGRTNRTLERFVVRLVSGERARGIIRLEGQRETTVRVLANGEPAGEFALGEEDGDWVEREFEVPARAAGPRTLIELRVQGAPLTIFHYWFARGS